MKTRLLFVMILCSIGSLSINVFSQNDVMMQAFYWDVPVDETSKNGTWWDNLSSKAAELKTAGIVGIWVPPPSKGNWGIIDNGYGIFDHYDLGNYNQKGSVETRFGSKQELLNMINVMHQSPKINVYADVVLNHVYSNEDDEEVNPGVKAYVFGEAHNETYVPFETNGVKWVIPNAAPGDYYIQIKGYGLQWQGTTEERAYSIEINWDGSATKPDLGTNWESEPNNGNGNTNNYPGSGYIVRGHADYKGDVDEFKITVIQTHDIIIRLEAHRESQNPYEWQWADQKNGYYPVAVWYNGNNLATTTLQARTNTGIHYVNHTQGEPNYSWTYYHFHPSDANDWLGSYGSDEVITNTIFFGNDFNTFNSEVQQRLKNWGYWLTSTIGFDGYRLDFVRGFQETFVADWVNNLPLVDGEQPFIVGEYWGADYRIKSWVNTVASHGAQVNGFDFPLKSTLTEMCNGNGSSFNMSWLNHAGMARNSGGNGLPGTSIVTFIDNHDTGKEHDKWVTKDHKLAYAYMLTHEGRPCVFYPHFYGVTQHDSHNNTITTTASTSLKDDIEFLIDVRKTYLDSTLEVLTEVGNPYPVSDVNNVYVARRHGNGTKGGAIIVLNNHNDQTKGVWVDTSPGGFEDWAGAYLINLQTDEVIRVEADGRAYFNAPARGYSIWVKEGDLLPSLQNKSMVIDANSVSTIHELSSTAMITVYNLSGILIRKNITKSYLLEDNLPPGIYIARSIENNVVQTVKFIVK